jgi:transposase
MSVRRQTREQLTYEVVLLARQKVPWRAIARSLGVSRNTVKKIVEAHSEQRDAGHTALARPAPRLPRASKLDSFKPRVAELLKEYPDITAQRVFEIVREEGFGGGYTAVKKHVRKVRPKPPAKPSLETPAWGPGKMAESDWSPYDVTYTTGQTQRLQLFSYVLVHSRRKFYQAYDSYDLHALMTGHAEAFARFGGCAERCKYDGQSAVARWEGSQPIYNPLFLAFCTHYEMRPWAIRGDPNLRPRVERSFWEHERSFLNGRKFRDANDFRSQLAYWLDNTVDHRRRRRTDPTPLDRFAEEAPHLLPLPRHPYDTARVVYRLCSIDGFVDWQGNRYAVPYDHVTDILPVRITQRELFVYAPDIRCIARHELGPRGGGLAFDPAGFHLRRVRQAATDLDQLRVAYEGMGPGASEFFRCLSAGPPRSWSHQARRILGLRERYTTQALDATLLHACHFGAFGFESVQRILETRHPPRTLDEYVAAETADRIRKLLGDRTTEPRDLREYDRLALETTRSDDVTHDGHDGHDDHQDGYHERTEG